MIISVTWEASEASTYSYEFWGQEDYYKKIVLEDLKCFPCSQMTFSCIFLWNKDGMVGIIIALVRGQRN